MIDVKEFKRSFIHKNKAVRLLQPPCKPKYPFVTVWLFTSYDDSDLRKDGKELI